MHLVLFDTFISLSYQASNAIDLLNNTLTALVVDQIDNMISLLFLNWLRSNYNAMSSASNFMIVKSSRSIESHLVFVYVIAIMYSSSILF